MLILTSVVPLFTFGLFQLSSAEGFTQCYYPDGSIPTDYLWEPCTGAKYSSCCVPSEGDICQADGLCYYPAENLSYRGTCTDRTWNDPSCNANICVTGMQNLFPDFLIVLHHLTIFLLQASKQLGTGLSNVMGLADPKLTSAAPSMPIYPTNPSMPPAPQTKQHKPALLQPHLPLQRAATPLLLQLTPRSILSSHPSIQRPSPQMLKPRL